MRVLIACEFSGVVRDAFLAKGHDAWSCDIVKGRGERHIQDDVTKYLKEEWDLIIAHPPCTYISNVGSPWLSMKSPDQRFERLLKMIEACDFFRECLNADASKVCVENPIPVGLALAKIGVKYTQIVHPWQFGHPYTKATCLWLKGLKKLMPTNIVTPIYCITPSGGGKRLAIRKNNRGCTKETVGRMRSIFHTGIALAMAEQWDKSEEMK